MRTIVTFCVALLLVVSAEASLAGKKICVDPGHGGSDPGALGVNGSTYPDEADLVLDVDLRFRTLLVNDSASVLMTRDSDTTVSLDSRVDQANSWGATIFLSTHLNSSDLESANGTETYAYQSGGSSDTLAHKVQEELIAHMQRTDRGVKYAGYYVIKYTNMPAILSEGLFVSNTGDFTYITSAAGKEAHAVALYHAVCSYFGVTPQDGGGTTTPGSVKGFVYNLSTGLGNVEDNRIADATITLAPASGTPLTTTSSSTGLFTFSSVEPGTYTLSVSKSGFISAEKVITVSSGTETWASTGIEEAAGNPTATLKGFVYDLSSGLGNIEENRLSGATCRLKSDADGTETVVESGMNGLAGYFFFADLTPGNYTLTIEKAGYQTVVRSLTLVEGDNWASTGLEVAAGVTTGAVTGTVYSLTMRYNQATIAGATVVLTPVGTGETLSTATDAAGSFSFSNVEAGEYTLAASADGYEDAEKPVTVIAGQTVMVNIGLSPTGSTDETILVEGDTETPEEDIILLPDGEEPTEEDRENGTDAVQPPLDEEGIEAVTDEISVEEQAEDESGCSCAIVW